MGERTVGEEEDGDGFAVLFVEDVLELIHEFEIGRAGWKNKSATCGTSIHGLQLMGKRSYRGS